MKWSWRSWLVIALGASVPGVASAQHEMHGMDMGAGWRMVPMDMDMPMLPGWAWVMTIS